MKYSIIASSPSLDGIRKHIAAFYYGATVTLTPHETNANTWTVSTGKGLCPSVIVRNVNGRYRFDRLAETVPVNV